LGLSLGDFFPTLLHVFFQGRSWSGIVKEFLPGILDFLRKNHQHIDRLAIGYGSRLRQLDLAVLVDPLDCFHKLSFCNTILSLTPPL